MLHQLFSNRAVVTVERIGTEYVTHMDFHAFCCCTVIRFFQQRERCDWGEIIPSKHKLVHAGVRTCRLSQNDVTNSHVLLHTSACSHANEVFDAIFANQLIGIDGERWNPHA
ncbi:hypothetical protein D3C76_1430390 [compost metagenome]